MGGEVLIIASVEASFVEASQIGGAESTFMYPSIVISMGASSVSEDLVSIAMLIHSKAVDFLAHWKWAQNVGNCCPRFACEALQVAEPIKFGIPLGNLLAPGKER